MDIVQRKKEIGSQLSSQSNRLKALITNDIERKKFIATLQDVALNPMLSECTPESIVKSALQAAELNLSLNKNKGLAYIVKYRYDAEFQVGYKGWQMLAKRAGIKLRATPIYNIDKFSLESDGFDTSVHYIPDLANLHDEDPNWVDEHMIGVLIATKEDDEIKHDFVTIGKIRQISGMSKTKGAKYSPYLEWRKEMYIGKAIKYVLSKMPIEDENVHKAVEYEDQGDIVRVEKAKVEERHLSEQEQQLYNVLTEKLKAFNDAGNNEQPLLTLIAQHDCRDWIDVAKNQALATECLQKMDNVLNAEEAQYTEVNKGAA